MEQETKKNNPEKKNDQEQTVEKVELRLGDIIRIEDPEDDDLNNQTFIIDYIDELRMNLINTKSFDTKKLPINDGIIAGDTITKIVLISRNPELGFARQNGLITGVWVNITFEGDTPVIFVGQITNLENDMIEIKTIDDEVLYIDFEYKGVPEHLELKSIEIRDEPPKRASPLSLEEGEFILEDESEVPTSVPQTKNIKEQLREIILNADQIVFLDEELGPIKYFVEVSEKKQRYSIEAQVTDLLDDLLSTIPNNKRTDFVMEKIHLMIERFKQLRTQFSTFDTNGNVTGRLVKGVDYKPLTSYFKELDINLYWIVPIVKNVKKIYDILEVKDDIMINDVESLIIKDEVSFLTEKIEQYKSNSIQYNKYFTLYNQIDPFFTPFKLVDDETPDGILMDKGSKTDLCVIVENFDDFKSSAVMNNKLVNRKFMVEKYNQGLTRLDVIEDSRLSHRVPMTPNDVLSITSFLTLPEPVIRFSRINLPGTNLMDKAMLNQTSLQLWRLLNKKTSVKSVPVLNEDINYDESTFANEIKRFVYAEPDKLNSDNQKGVYQSFIERITPQTNILFNLMKRHIVGKFSIVDVISSLEPFLVYTDSLTYSQYVNITNFIRNQTSIYNRKYVDRSKMFSLLKSNDSSVPNNTINDNIHGKYKETINQSYSLDKTDNITTNEALRKIMIQDSGRLYASILSLENESLVLSDDLSSLFKKELIKDEPKEEREDCNTIVIAKGYANIDELEQDNKRDIYFDKRFDKTDYNLIDDYETAISRMKHDEFEKYLIADLEKKKKIMGDRAKYLAETLISGYKKVQDGQYAILFDKDATGFDYYIREKNVWTKTVKPVDKLFSNDEDILCNLQKNCMNNTTGYDDNCESMERTASQNKNELLNDMINEFDEKYIVSRKLLKQKLLDEYEYRLSIVDSIRRISIGTMMKYNNQKLAMAVTEEVVGEVSPFLKIRDLILVQRDFVKKQHDIIRFVKEFTRNAITTGLGPLGDIETPHWLYCTESNVKLLPTFKYNMATVFLTDRDNYTDYIEQLKTEIGKKSDDGDKWVDKHSGWPFCSIDLDVEEGYEETGFKASTRAILEKDISIETSLANRLTFDTPESKIVSSVVDTVSFAMGVNIASHKLFIVNSVLSTLSSIPSRSQYEVEEKNALKKGKVIPSFDVFYNTHLLYCSLGMLLISIQTAIPSIKTRKTYPNCARSFKGFPFDDANDLKAVEYISCVVHKIKKSNTNPWLILRKVKQTTIRDEIKEYTSDFLLSLPDVIRRIQEKTEHLLIDTSEAVPEEYNVHSWTGFLPPLSKIEIKRLSNVSNEFKNNLMEDFKSGSRKQTEKLLVINSKIILFSLALQEKIHDVVSKKESILFNSYNEPYLENSCCYGKKDENTIQYFINEDATIQQCNDTVIKLTNLMADIVSLSKASMLISNINTKNIYPPVTQVFDERTIYLAFINYCKFKSNAPIPPELLSLCKEKPEINVNDSLGELIRKLKENGYKYNDEQFLKLLQIQANENRISVQIDNSNHSSVYQLTRLLESLNAGDEVNIDPNLKSMISDVIDTYDVVSDKMTNESKALDTLLNKNINEMKMQLLKFIKDNYGEKMDNKTNARMTRFVQTMSDWSTDKSKRNDNKKISNEAIYNNLNFFRTFVSMFANVFPNIILNKVDYLDTAIPSYWNLSSIHSGKLKQKITEYYSGLKVFYDSVALTKLLNKVQDLGKVWTMFAEVTPCFSTTKDDEGKDNYPILNERIGKQLFEYYLLSTLMNYIKMSEDTKMIMVKSAKKTDVDELLTLEFVEDEETRANMDDSVEDDTDMFIQKGNLKELKRSTAHLLFSFLSIMDNHKDAIDISYEDILDKVFKLKEKEKHMIMDRLVAMSDDEKEVDRVLKINKLEAWGKGLEKSYTVFDRDAYDRNFEFTETMDKLERNLRKKNKEVDDDNIDLYLGDFVAEAAAAEEIERDVYDMGRQTDDYDNGDPEGYEVDDFDSSYL
jgi:hypothetical protein